jgi:hypothetical protein
MLENANKIFVVFTNFDPNKIQKLAPQNRICIQSVVGVDEYRDLRRRHVVIGRLFLAVSCTAAPGTATAAGCGGTLTRRDAPATTATRGPTRRAQA